MNRRDDMALDDSGLSRERTLSRNASRNASLNKSAAPSPKGCDAAFIIGLVSTTLWSTTIFPPSFDSPPCERPPCERPPCDERPLPDEVKLVGGPWLASTKSSESLLLPLLSSPDIMIAVEPVYRFIDALIGISYSTAGSV